MYGHGHTKPLGLGDQIWLWTVLFMDLDVVFNIIQFIESVDKIAFVLYAQVFV